MKNKKILSVILLVVVISTLFVPLFSIGASAVTYPIYPVSIPTDSILRSFDGFCSLGIYNSETNTFDNLFYQNASGVVETNVDGFSSSLLDSMAYRPIDQYGQYGEPLYITLSLVCQYSSIYLNDVLYSISIGNVLSIELDTTPTALYFGADSSSYIDNVFERCTYNIQIYLGTGENVAYDEGYQQGYVDGAEANYEEVYQLGYDAGVNATDSSKFGHNLLGETLGAPIKALNNFTLYEYTMLNNTYQITLGHVVGGVIALTLFIAFLKVFAGG